MSTIVPVLTVLSASCFLLAQVSRAAALARIGATDGVAAGQFVYSIPTSANNRDLANCLLNVMVVLLIYAIGSTTTGSRLKLAKWAWYSIVCVIVAVQLLSKQYSGTSS